MTDLARAIGGRIRGEVGCCLTELNRLRQVKHTRLSISAAVGASALVVVLGNGVVLAGRRLGHDEWTTLFAVPVIGLAGAYFLRLRGWAWSDLGFSWLVTGAPRWLFWAALTLAGSCGAIGLVAGASVPPLNVVRLIVGTAIGEEIVHRSVVLGIWASTTVGRGWIVAANGLVFALWHVAGASDKCGFHWVEVAGPGALALVLLWARLRFRSVFAPAAFHTGGNMLDFLP